MPGLSSTLLKAPVNVTWEITRACNLTCSHCLSADLRARGGAPAAASAPLPVAAPAGEGSGSSDASLPRSAEADRWQAPSGELGLKQCRDLVDELARMEVFQINFGGGEPFLRPDFLPLLRYAHLRGLTTCVSTNGTVLTDCLIDSLLEIAPVYLQVSLDGASADTNDAIRGAGTFERIMTGIELLADRNYPDFSLNMVVTRLNAGELAEFHQLARRYGAKTRLSRFRPSGAGCGTWEDYRLTKDQLLELSGFLGDHLEILTGDSFFALTPESRRHLGLNMCGAAKMTCAVAPDGGVYPCAFLSQPEFLAGNVTERPLSLIFAESPVLQTFRGLVVESCRGCDRFDICHGGCPAVGYFLSRSTNMPDPECLRALLAAQEGLDA